MIPLIMREIYYLLGNHLVSQEMEQAKLWRTNELHRNNQVVTDYKTINVDTSVKNYNAFDYNSIVKNYNTFDYNSIVNIPQKL